MDLEIILQLILYVILGAFFLLVFIAFPLALYSQRKERQALEQRKYEEQHIGHREEPIY